MPKAPTAHATERNKAEAGKPISISRQVEKPIFVGIIIGRIAYGL